MGVTLCSLLIPKTVYTGMRIDAGYTVRESTSGWVSILPQFQEGDSILKPLNELTQLAKQGVGPCLLFFYGDDDEFSLSLYMDGKKQGTVDSFGKRSGITQFEKALSDIPELGNKLKMLSRCKTFDEQISLLEETFGIALYDLWDMEPRAVRQSEETYREIIAREEKLKRLKNRFRAVEIEENEWPEGLMEQLRWDQMPMKQRRQIKLLPFPKWLSQYGRVARIGLYSRTGIPWYLPEGDSIFRTEAPGEAGAVMWRISGKDGSVLLRRDLPDVPDERFWYMRYVPSAGMYLYSPDEQKMEQKKRLRQEYAVALDDEFKEIHRFSLERGCFLSKDFTVFCGHFAWILQHARKDTYVRLNLKTGEKKIIRLEVPAVLKFALADGTLLAMDWNEWAVYCFDAEGHLLSRHKGNARMNAWADDGHMYFWYAREMNDPRLHELPDQVWRLDEVYRALSVL